MKAVWESITQFLSDNAIEFVIQLLLGFLVLIVGFKLTGVFMRLLKRSKAAKKLDPTVMSFVSSFCGILLKALVIVIFAGIVGIPTASIIAILGSVGVAVGLALQGSLSNLAGGVMILLFKPFVKGDYVDLPNASAGTVTDISIFYTTLVTLDNRRVVIPNGIVSNATLINFSANSTRRIELDFSAEYEADSETVRRVILSAVKEREKLLPDPAPDVILKSMDDSAVVYQLRCWCQSTDYLGESAALRELVKKRFHEQGLSIPFPQMDIHMK